MILKLHYSTLLQRSVVISLSIASTHKIYIFRHGVGTLGCGVTRVSTHALGQTWVKGSVYGQTKLKGSFSFSISQTKGPKINLLSFI